MEARKPAKAFYRMRRHDGEYREMEAWVTPVIAQASAAWTGRTDSSPSVPPRPTHCSGARLWKARALPCAPMRIGGVLTGLLVVSQSLPRTWSESERLLAHQVAMRLASHMVRSRR